MCIVENNEQLLTVKLRITRSLSLEASFASWEDHRYLSPPHVLNPPKIGAPVEVVRDNISPSTCKAEIN